jgi:hypothetical protein
VSNRSKILLMDNTYLEARAQSQRLKSAQTMPIAKFSEGDTIQTKHGEAIVLQVIFNRAVWTHSYKVVIGEDIREIIEWSL